MSVLNDDRKLQKGHKRGGVGVDKYSKNQGKRK